MKYSLQQALASAAFGLAVVVIILNLLDTLEPRTLTTLLGLALVCEALVLLGVLHRSEPEK
ncbi:MAG TPA: hypothetical protein VFI42_08520 [Thermomicrobiaceae bacterium]|nr:hypothetical protein [Thermomicrobiaceae bacterium]